jgi:hypothetical protein
MKEIHLTGIDYVEYNTMDGIEFKYKPEVPKLKVIGNILVADENEEDESQGIVFLTQKQLNQILINKEVELAVSDDNRWYPVKPLNKEQAKKIGLVTLESEFLGTISEIKSFEVIKVSE